MSKIRVVFAVVFLGLATVMGASIAGSGAFADGHMNGCQNADGSRC